jgi:hypothetical protein
MKIYYRKEYPGFYFMTSRENGLWCFSPEIPDIDTLQLCECSLGKYEDQAFEEAVEVPHDLMVKFNSIYNKKSNYADVCEILKTVFEVSQEELDEMYEHDPEMIAKTKEVIDFCTDGKIDGFFFRQTHQKVRHLLSIWDNDLDRVKNYMKEHGDLDFYWDGAMVDIFGCEDKRRRMSVDPCCVGLEEEKKNIVLPMIRSQRIQRYPLCLRGFRCSSL